MIEAKQLDKQFCSWFASDCILTNLSSVISQVMVEEYRLHEPSTAIALASNVSSEESASDYEDFVAVNDDGDEIDFPPPGTIQLQFPSCRGYNFEFYNIAPCRLVVKS